MTIFKLSACLPLLAFGFLACDSGTSPLPSESSPLSGRYTWDVEDSDLSIAYEFISATKATYFYTDGNSHATVEMEYSIKGNKFLSTFLMLGTRNPRPVQIIEYSDTAFTLFDKIEGYSGEGPGGINRRWISAADTLTIEGDSLLTWAYVDKQEQNSSLPIRIVDGKIFLRYEKVSLTDALYRYEISGDSLHLYYGSGVTYRKGDV